VRVRTIEVESIEAQLTAIDDASVRLIIDGEEKALPLESILHIATDAPPAQTIKSASEVVCHLVGGGVISGAVGADASPGVVRLNVQESLSLDLPLASIAAIRFPGASDQALQDEFNARRMERKPGRDVLLLLN